MTEPRRRWRYRSSETGKFVRKEFSDANPNTTTRERVKEKPPC